MQPGRPRWSAQSTLLLPIPAAIWSPPQAPLLLDGIAFAPKVELHITLVGRRLGTEIMAAARGAGAAPALEALLATADWSFARRREWLRLMKRAGGRRRDSIIERVELPAMAPLHARLGALLGRALPVPPPHATLYTAGDARGIGLPDEASLARHAVRRVAAGELGFGDEAEAR